MAAKKLTVDAVLEAAIRQGAKVRVVGHEGRCWAFDSPQDYRWASGKTCCFHLNLEDKTPGDERRDLGVAMDRVAGGLESWRWPALEDLVREVGQLGGSAHRPASADDCWTFSAPSGLRWADAEDDVLILPVRELPGADQTREEFQSCLNEVMLCIERGFEPWDPEVEGS